MRASASARAATRPRPRSHSRSAVLGTTGPTGAELGGPQARRSRAARAGTTHSSWEGVRAEPGFEKVVDLLRLCGFVADVRFVAWTGGAQCAYGEAVEG